MRRPVLVLLLGLGLGPALVPPAAAEVRVPADAAEITLSFAPVVKRAAPAVVNIYARRVVQSRSPFAGDPFFENFFRDFQSGPRVQNSLGSGVIVSADGIVVSNFHVVSQSTEIRAVLADRREFDAEVLLADEESDLAVLRLKGAADLPTLPFRDSDGVEVGELVLAIGNPFGIGQTVSSGIVSGLARSGALTGNARGYFIQTDAAINPGNSGGPLVDTAGRLVGVNTAILTRSGGSNGIGFAIPANLVARFVEQAEAGQTRFQRPWAGISGQPVDAGLAEGFGMRVPEGMVITALHADSPFRAAGLATGDIVLGIDGEPVNTPSEMLYRMAARGLGRSARIEYLRGGTRHGAEVAMILAPETPPREALAITADVALRGLAVANVNPAVIAEAGLALDARGVVVTAAEDIAGRFGLRPGDLLLRINDIAIARTADVARAAAQRTRNWFIEYARDGRRNVIRVRL
jgi:Do/DeqQ family serine protease